MGRMHLFEFEDLPWFPQNIRACMQDHLRFMGDLSAPTYKGFVEKLKSAMERSGQRRILDLCSGGGGPMRTILQLLRAQNFEATALVTDLYPNIAAYRQLERDSDGTIQGYVLRSMPQMSHLNSVDFACSQTDSIIFALKMLVWY